MPGAGKAEIYFIAGMMILILFVSAVSVYFFFTTYKKEKLERESRNAESNKAAGPAKRGE